VSSPFDVPDPPKPHELLSDYVEHLKSKAAESAQEAEDWKRQVKPLQKQVCDMRVAGDALADLITQKEISGDVRAILAAWEKVKEP